MAMYFPKKSRPNMFESLSEIPIACHSQSALAGHVMLTYQYQSNQNAIQDQGVFL